MIQTVYFTNVFEPDKRETFTTLAAVGAELPSLMPSGVELSDPATVVYVDGKVWTGDRVEPGSQVVVVRRPAFTGAVLWQLLIAVVMMAASAILAKRAMGQDPPAEKDSFKGFSNSYFSGGAIPLVFGERRVAPPVVGQVIESSFAAWTLSNRQTLKALLALGHGPIAGLGTAIGTVANTADYISVTSNGGTFGLPGKPADIIGLKVNGQPAANYTDVIVEWRTGEIDQTPIAGFPDSSVDTTVGQSVLEYSDAIDITDAGKPNGVLTSGNEIDDTLGNSLAVVMADVADRYILTLSFPKGLYKDAGGGGTTTSTASFRFQFWPVDAIGTRTGDTVLLPEIHVQGDTLTPQVYQIPGGLFSPQSYTPTAQLGYLNADGYLQHALVTAPINPATFPSSFADRDALKFSAACWVRSKAEGTHRLKPIFMAKKGTLSNALFAGIDWPYHPLASADTTAHSGTMFALERQLVEWWNPGVWQLSLYVWRGFTRSVWYSPPISGSVVNEWLHAGVAWDGSTGTPVFYLNGQPMGGHTVVGSLKPAMFEEADMLIGHNGASSAGTSTQGLLVDEVDLCDLAISDTVRDASWFWQASNVVDPQGLKLTYHDPAADALIVFASRLSEEIAAGKIEQLAFPASTTVGEVVEYIGGALLAAPQASSPLWYPASGTPLRDRYQLELFRSNAETDDGGVEVNVAEWDIVTLITDEDFEHPGVAMLAVSIDADDQISDSRPTYTVIERGAKVPIWDGSSSEFPVFNWAWSRNPAWCALYAGTEEEVGLGAIWNRTKNIDLEAWKAWADYCDEGVEDGAGVPAFSVGTPVTASGSHPDGELHFAIGLLDASGVSTGESLPTTWVVGATIKIKTASDASWLVASADASVRLEITSIQYKSDDLAANGFQHWVQVEVDWTPLYTLPGVGSVTGTAVGVEARHECDLILDRKDSDGWNEMLGIMRAARAAPVIIGDKLSVVVDRARAVDFLITQAQMEKGSMVFSWSSTQDRYNSIEFEYDDRLQDYELDVLQEDHPSVSGEVAPEKIRKAPPQQLRGVVRRSEARRQAIYQLNQWHLLCKACRFSLGIDGIGLTPGDHIRIAHDVPLIGQAGRVYADGTATTIKLDRDVVVFFGSTYEIEVRASGTVDVDGKEIREVASLHASMIPVSGSSLLAAGSTITLAGAGFATLVPEQGDVYSFGETDATADDFTVTSVTLDPTTFVRRVDCLEYNADVYTDNEFGVLPPDPIVNVPPTSGGGGGGGGGFGGGIKNPGDHYGSLGGPVTAAIERSFLGIDGKPTASVVVTWPKATYGAEASGGTAIWMSSATDGTTPAPKKIGTAPPGATSLTISGEHLRSGTTVRFHIQRLNARGEGRTPIGCPSFKMVVGGRVKSNASGAPIVLSPKSRQSHGVYQISFPDGQTPEGVEVRVGGWILGQKVAHALRDGDLTSTQWVFGADNAALDGAYTHQVRSLLPSGQVSAAATFVNEDAVPLGMTAVEDTAHEDAWGSGTLDGMQITDGYLEFASGSHLEGSWTSAAVDLTDASRYMVEVAAQAEQRHPMLLEDMIQPLNSRAYANWLLEGPTGGSDAQACRLSIEWLPSATATLPPSSGWATLRPGEAYFRKAQFRVRITRPLATFNVRVKRFGVRVLSLPGFNSGDLDGGSF